MQTGTPSKNLISYRASAGSGKTYTLAVEYISLCLTTKDPSYFRKILAITFTNKAAAELKERILDFTKHLITAEDGDDMLIAVEERCHIGAEQIRSRAKKVFSQMLYSYADIHVSTIDHFVLSILKAFSKEMGLSFDFKVELDQGRISELLVDELMRHIGQDEFITETLVAYSYSKLDDGSSWNPRRDLVASTQELFKESSAEALNALGELDDEVIRSGIETLKIQMDHLKKHILVTQKEAKDLLITNGLELSDFHGVSKSPAAIFSRDMDAMGYQPTDGQRNKMDEMAPSGKSKNRGTAETLIPGLIDLGTSIVKDCDMRMLISLVHKERLSLLLANRLSKLLKQLEKEEDMSLLSGNNQRIANVVRGNPAPFIYERLGERFRHFLIDEFQDTSLNQWHNFLPLIDNSLSQGYKNLLVGDAKQSIYRWRNSEVEQIIALPDIHKKGEDSELNRMSELMARTHDSKGLNVNYRSAKAIIAFNNSLFSSLRALLSPELALAYSDVDQEHRKTSKGYVEIHFIEKDVRLEDRFEQILSWIGSCQSDGYALGEIGILVRKNREGQAIANALQEHGIAVNSSDSLLLYGSDNVHLLLNFLQFIHGKKQAKADLYVLHHILERYDEPLRFHQLAKAYHYKGSSVLWELFKEKDLQINLKLHLSESIYESAERLCREIWLDEGDPYLQEFMNRLLLHSLNADSSLDGFMEEFERSKWKWSITAAPSDDAVQLMTIHRSKGLQFPVVILPYWKSKTRGHSPKEWFPWDSEPFAQVMLPLTGKLENTPYTPALQREKELQAMDELNLLYVACTRPETRLYMTMVEEGTLVGAVKNHLEPRMEGSIYLEGSTEPHVSKRTSEAKELGKPIPKADPKVLLRTTARSESLYSKEREFGKMVHKILEKNERLEDVPFFIDQLSSGMSLSTDERIELERSVKAALHTEKELKLGERGFVCSKEQEILSPDGRISRLDRLYLNPSNQSAVILDFKTGKPDKKDLQQMERYQELLKAMGYAETEAYLLYTQNAELIQVRS